MAITQDDNLLIQSYLTTSFLIELRNNNFLSSDYFKNLPFEDTNVKQLLPRIGIDNQGALLMCLYSLLVIPKQLLSDKFPSEFVNLNRRIDIIKSSAESTYDYDKSNIEYIRHIRNAVAHSRVSFQPNQDVTFCDIDKKNKAKCTITIPLDKVGILLTHLQNIFILYYNSLSKV